MLQQRVSGFRQLALRLPMKTFVESANGKFRDAGSRAWPMRVKLSDWQFVLPRSGGPQNDGGYL